MKSISGGTLLKRRSTRHVSKITAIASKFGNSAKIIVPSSWLRKRMIAFLHWEYISKHPGGSKKQMSSESLLSNIIPFAGSGLLGYAMGFALKKILKWMLIIVGFLTGMLFVVVQLLQKYGYLSTVNWDKLGNDTSTQIQHMTANVDVTNVHSLFHTFGIPVSSGLGLGLLAGFVRTR